MHSHFLLVLFMLVSSCAASKQRTTVTVTGRAIQSEFARLAKNGEAKVEARTRINGGDAKTSYESIRVEQRLRYNDTTLVVGDMMEHCSAIIPYSSDKLSGRDCPLVQMSDVPLLVRTSIREKSRAPEALALTWVVALAASATCLLACDDNSTANTASLIVFGGSTAIGVGVVGWLLLRCITGTGRCTH